MIKTWEDLGEVLNDFETRLLCLENSLPHFKEEESHETHAPEPEWAKGQWDVLQQLKAEVVGWRERSSRILLEMDTLKKKSSVKGKSKYDYL